MATDKRRKDLIINQLTKAQYDEITPKDDELYFITDLPSVDIATYDKAGIIRPDRNTLSIDENGTLSVQQGVVEKIEAKQAYTVDLATGVDTRDPENTKFKTLTFLIDYLKECFRVHSNGTTITVAAGTQTFPHNLNFTGLETNGGILKIDGQIATRCILQCQNGFAPAIKIKDTKTKVVFDACTLEFSAQNSSEPFCYLDHGQLMVSNSDINIPNFRAKKLFSINNNSTFELEGGITYNGSLVDFVSADNSTFITNSFSFLPFPKEKISHIFNGTNSWWIDTSPNGHTTTDSFEVAQLKYGSTLFVSETEYSQFFPTLPLPTKDVTCKIYDKTGLIG